MIPKKIDDLIDMNVVDFSAEMGNYTFAQCNYVSKMLEAEQSRAQQLRNKLQKKIGRHLDLEEPSEDEVAFINTFVQESRINERIQLSQVHMATKGVDLSTFKN